MKGSALTLADCLTSVWATTRAHQIAPFRATSRNHPLLVTFGQEPWTRLPPVLSPVLWKLQSRSAPSARIPLEFIHGYVSRSEEHTSELQSPDHLVCRLLLEKKKKNKLLIIEYIKLRL